MNMILEKWLTTNKDLLNEYGVIIDNFKSGDIGFVDKATSFDLQFKNHIARITLSHSGKLYAHIIEINSNETIFLYDNEVKFNESELNGFLICFIQILIG